MTRKTLRPLMALSGALAVLLLAAAPAAAHGGDGEIAVTSSTRDGDSVTITVHLNYIEDGHGVPDATVTAVVDDATPVPMEAGAEEGDYTATVTAAEGAVIRVTSVEPATSVEAPAPGEGTASTTTSVVEDETTTTAAAPTTEASTTTAADDGADEDAVPALDPTSAEGDDGGSNTGLIVGAVVAIVAAAAVVAALVLRKKPDGTTGLDA